MAGADVSLCDSRHGPIKPCTSLCPRKNNFMLGDPGAYTRGPKDHINIGSHILVPRQT